MSDWPRGRSPNIDRLIWPATDPFCDTYRPVFHPLLPLPLILISLSPPPPPPPFFIPVAIPPGLLVVLDSLSHRHPITHISRSMATTTTFAMDFDHNKPLYPEDQFTSYLDNSMDYGLTPFPQSPAYGISVGLPTESPLSFATLNLPTATEYTYSPSPARPYTPEDGHSVSPPSLTYQLSAGELSSDGMPSGRRSRASTISGSPANVSYAATVPRSHRFNPIVPPSVRPAARAQHKRKLSRNDDSDEEDEEFMPPQASSGNDSRRETIRRQRIESEQRRRDELRDGYSRLKETLPASNQKSSKVSLLDRATSHLKYLESMRTRLESQLKAAEQEVHRLRSVNEALMLGTARHAAPAPVF
ncbi:hypothetical protein E4T56_gene16647 [Termitomyces sp. T112]|nr:hypothetical protein E4T56_gene16647 [Termitomyces sp. T112]